MGSAARTAIGADPDHHQQAELLSLETNLEVDPIDPRYYRRGRLLDALLGSAAQLPSIVWQTINATKKVPAITGL